jgi:hypothetical protein
MRDSTLRNLDGGVRGGGGEIGMIILENIQKAYLQSVVKDFRAS